MLFIPFLITNFSPLFKGLGDFKIQLLRGKEELQFHWDLPSGSWHFQKPAGQ